MGIPVVYHWKFDFTLLGINHLEELAIQENFYGNKNMGKDTEYLKGWKGL